jgi:hypothetical protein
MKCPKCDFNMSVRPAVQANARGGRARNTTSELERLARLHKSGALTDDEFAAAKARALSGT